MLGFVLVAVLGQAPVPELPAVTVRVGFSCADDSQELVLTPKALVAVQVPEPCRGAGKKLHLELACSERCVGRVSAEGGTIAELSGPGTRAVFESELSYELGAKATGTTTGAGVAMPRVEVVPEKKLVVQADMDVDLWIAFYWDKPWHGGVGVRAEPGALVTIDDRAGVLARLDRVGSALVRVRVWCGRNESDDTVVDQVLPLPEGKMSADCKGLGGLCSGTVEISIREA